MLLAIDIGNTNITLGVWDGHIWRQQWRLLTMLAKTADEYGITLKALLREYNMAHEVTHVVLASVVPALATTFGQVTQQYLRCPLVEVGPDTDTGIQICVDNPSALGADRVVNVAAAYHLYQGPAIVIDMGTATKFDVVTAAGDFCGGVIAPGLGLAADALASRAARLSHVALVAPPQTLGRNTVHAMQSGLIFGYVGLIEGVVNRLLAEHPDQGQHIHVIGTGGMITLITPHTAVIEHVDPWITLTGLRLIHDRVTGKGVIT